MALERGSQLERANQREPAQTYTILLNPSLVIPWRIEAMSRGRRKRFHQFVTLDRWFAIHYSVQYEYF